MGGRQVLDNYIFMLWLCTDRNDKRICLGRDIMNKKKNGKNQNLSVPGGPTQNPTCSFTYFYDLGKRCHWRHNNTRAFLFDMCAFQGSPKYIFKPRTSHILENNYETHSNKNCLSFSDTHTYTHTSHCLKISVHRLEPLAKSNFECGG